MKKLIIIPLLLLLSDYCFSQTVVRDPWHLSIVNANASRRLVAELGYQSSLDVIRKNTDDIAINLSSVALVQTMIHRSLTEVNEGLKDAIQIKQLGYLINDIIKYSNEAIQLARGNPALLLFAENSAREMKIRGLSLANDVSGFVLDNKKEVLINHNVRDQLIRKVVTELQIMNALIYSIKTNMYWAKQRGLIKSLNPYQQYIDKDIALIDGILQKRERLKY